MATVKAREGSAKAVSKSAGKTAEGRKAVSKKTAMRKGEQPTSMPKAGKDPRGGLTAKGRDFFNKKEGSHLRPGVKGAADTPEKMVRKGSFLRRHFANPRGPMVDEQGRPTRLALSAQAWGEPLPKTMADAGKLADKGHKLLEQYHKVHDKQPAGAAKKAGKTAAKKSTKAPAKKATSKVFSETSRKTSTASRS